MPSYHVDLTSGRVFREPRSRSTEHLVSTIPLGPGETYFLVYVDYTTGNSYGRDPETYHELVDAYRTEAEAVAVAKAIRAYDLTLRLGNGEERKMGWPWRGYFERLEAVHILPISTIWPVRLIF